MTTDTLAAHKRAYRAGTITRNDQEAMVGELIDRDDKVEEAKKNLRQTTANAVETFLEVIGLE